MALGIEPGDEVIVPDLTFIATANAARLAGAAVVLVDVDPHRLTLSPQAVEAAITPRTRAVVPVDVNGRGADYVALERICRDRGLVMVCDAAEALGSRYDGKPLGSYGDAACFSFSPNKTLTTGQGGMIVTKSASMADRLYELKDQGRRVRGSGGDDLHPVMGFNFKFTDLQAAVGLAQLEAFDARTRTGGQTGRLVPRGAVGSRCGSPSRTWTLRPARCGNGRTCFSSSATWCAQPSMTSASARARSGSRCTVKHPTSRTACRSPFRPASPTVAYGCRRIST